MRMKLVGANPSPRVVGMEELPGKVNYFIGNDPAKWRTNVPTYAKVKYQGVYPGIDLVYYGNQRQLEYDFVVAPGTDPAVIQLAFEGAEDLRVDAQGDLILHLAGGDPRLHKPLVYQEVNGTRHPLSGSYVLNPGSGTSNPKFAFSNPQSAIRNPKLIVVGFQVAAYDQSKPLIIDPVLSYSTYLGGNSQELGLGITLDASRNVYVTGWTNSANFPIAVPAQAALGGGADAFVTKLNAAGSALVYSTYLGGSDDENVSASGAISVDAAGNAYVTGSTYSADFPTVGPVQATFGGARDAFVAKLNATGSTLVYSTYLGGSNAEDGSGIAVDSAGNAYVTGDTFSTDFPTASPFQAAFGGGGIDAFVTKLNGAGSALVYSTYLGGSFDDVGFGIAVDAAGNAYMTGRTSSSNFPTASPLQAGFGGSIDAFVTKLNAAGSALVYSTFLGGSSQDVGRGIAVDAAGNAYVTGDTESTNFPTASPVQAAIAGDRDAFVTKVYIQS